MNQFNAIGWVEIPVSDMERAIKFYEAVFGYKLKRNQLGPLDMAWFPSHDDAKGAAGSLVKHEFYKPSPDGVLVYFTSPTSDLESDLAKVEPAGGKIVVPKKPISAEYGYIAVISDTEGNRIAIHSRKG